MCVRPIGADPAWAATGFELCSRPLSGTIPAAWKGQGVLERCENSRVTYRECPVPRAVPLLTSRTMGWGWRSILSQGTQRVRRDLGRTENDTPLLRRQRWCQLRAAGVPGSWKRRAQGLPRPCRDSTALATHREPVPSGIIGPWACAICHPTDQTLAHQPPGQLASC